MTGKTLAIILLCLVPLQAARIVSVRECIPCERNKEGLIKRSRSAVKKFQRETPCPSTGKKTGACPGWQVNHSIPLACSWSVEMQKALDAPWNMAWLSVARKKVVDKTERNFCPAQEVVVQ